MFRYSSAAVGASALIPSTAAIPRHSVLLMTPPFDDLMMPYSSRNHPMGREEKHISCPQFACESLHKPGNLVQLVSLER